MIKLFRIHGAAYDAFDTMGTFLHAGRWHTAGARLVYTAENVSLAALEVLVHSGSRKFPPKVLTRIEVPEDISTEEAAAMDFTASQSFGDRWLSEKRTAVLRVPSAPVNGLEFNCILNPAHDEFARVRRSKAEKFPFDQRFFLER